jgi:hypothetical protein
MDDGVTALGAGQQQRQIADVTLDYFGALLSQFIRRTALQSHDLVAPLQQLPADG